MNSFFKAILYATCNGKLMEYSYEWRAFHDRLSMDDREDMKSIKVERRKESSKNYNSIMRVCDCNLLIPSKKGNI